MLVRLSLVGGTTCADLALMDGLYLRQPTLIHHIRIVIKVVSLIVDLRVPHLVVIVGKIVAVALVHCDTHRLPLGRCLVASIACTLVLDETV